MQSKLCIYFESFFACITKSLYSCIIYPFIFLRVSGHKNVNLFFVQNQRFLISIKKGILYLNNIPQTVDKLGVGCYTQHQVCLQSEALHMQCLFRENARKSNIHWERYLQNLRFPIHSHQVHIRRPFSALPLMYWKVNIPPHHS